MMDKRTKSILLYALLVIVIVTFVFVGVNPGSMNGDQFVVGRVNGIPIRWSEYKAEAQRLTEANRDALNGPDAEAVTRQIRQQAFYGLAQQKFSLQIAEKYGIMPNGQDVTGYILRTYDMFKDEEGRIDLALAEQRLNSFPPNVKRRIFKQAKEQLVLQNHLPSRIMGAAKVTLGEVRQAFEQRNTMVQIVFLYEENQSSENSLLPDSGGEASALDRASGYMAQGAGISAAATRAGLQVQASDWFYFGGPILKMGSTNEYHQTVQRSLDVHKAALSLQPGRPSPIFDTGAGRCIIMTVNRKQPNWQEFYKDYGTLHAELLMQKQRDYYDQWIQTEYQAHAKVTQNLDRIWGN